MGESVGSPRSLPSAPSVINPGSEIQPVKNSSLTVNVPRGLQGRVFIVNEKQESLPKRLNEDNGNPTEVLSGGADIRAPAAAGPPRQPWAQHAPLASRTAPSLASLPLLALGNGFYICSV